MNRFVEKEGEIMHIYEPYHSDPRYVTERKNGNADALLYYSDIDICAVCTSPAVTLIDWKLPLKLQTKINNLSTSFRKIDTQGKE